MSSRTTTDASSRPLIGRGSLRRGQLAGQVAVVTGAGGGIGFETARALAWLGATVVIAEIDAERGQTAAAAVRREAATWEAADKAGAVVVEAYPVDVGSEEAVDAFARQVLERHGRVDAVVNNATVTVIGSVAKTPVAEWDRSYRVNLRGPVLLARAFLPGMLERGYGVFACVPSSGAAPHLGAYEVMKTAQVELANTLDAELENTGVMALSVGPGIVLTDTATAAFRELGPLYGMTEAQFVAMSAQHLITVESAGAGFAAAVALAGEFAGQEIGSIQALIAAGIEPERPRGVVEAAAAPARTPTTASDTAEADRRGLAGRVRRTLEEQSAGWRQRPLFERQWVIRDFKKTAGAPVEQWLENLRQLEETLATSPHPVPPGRFPLSRLAGYYGRLAELAAGYEKDPVKREQTVAIVRGWQQEVQELIDVLGG